MNDIPQIEKVLFADCIVELEWIARDLMGKAYNLDHFEQLDKVVEWCISAADMVMEYCDMFRFVLFADHIKELQKQVLEIQQFYIYSCLTE